MRDSSITTELPLNVNPSSISTNHWVLAITPPVRGFSEACGHLAAVTLTSTGHLLWTRSCVKGWVCVDTIFAVVRHRGSHFAQVTWLGSASAAVLSLPLVTDGCSCGGDACFQGLQSVGCSPERLEVCHSWNRGRRLKMKQREKNDQVQDHVGHAHPWPHCPGHTSAPPSGSR